MAKEVRANPMEPSRDFPRRFLIFPNFFPIISAEGSARPRRSTIRG